MGEVYRARDTKLESRRRDQDPAGDVGRRCGSARAVSARSQDAGVVEPSEHREHSRPRGERWRHRARDGACRGRGSRAADRAGRDPTRRSVAHCASRSPRRSKPRMSKASSTAISSPRISRFAQTARSRCWTSVSRKRMEPVGSAPQRLAVADDHDTGDDAGGDDSRHGRVHVAGAGEGAGSGQAQRHLGLRVSCCTKC